MSILPDTSHDKDADGPTYPEQLKAAKFHYRTGINKVVDRIVSFVAHLLYHFDATEADYDPVGSGNDPGYLAGYLKKLLEGTEPMPSLDSDDQEVMDFFQGLSLADRRPLWRTAKFYNQMTDLTTL